ncbi:thiol-disulfide oxidoreductase DCC family protein [Aquisalimonas sp.]|uniref:thiol-disulfide oxidoreductase DCC family protein n=1 Tax=Aquisalimonas sp. TaxID=1872621 RepID=UPI0025C6BC7D|nr:DUF393 domain-containing protein [Aquisalimonas sp.]
MAKQPSLKVYYDGACPRCLHDRARYERLAGAAAAAVEWVDVTGNEETLRALGVEPRDALQALHVQDDQGTMHHGIEAYILLMRPVPALKPVAWMLGIPVLKDALEWGYRRCVKRRLARQGRLP